MVTSTTTEPLEVNLGQNSESYEDYFDPRFPSFLTVLLLVVGVFGNSLSILVFNQKSMKKNSTFIYLGFLCYIDIFVLLFGLGDIILIDYFKLIIRNKSIVSCRLHTFFTYSFTHLSSFILASVSVDRAIATNFLTFSKYYCTQKMAHKIILIMCLLTIFINIHSLLFLGYEEPVSFGTNSSETNKTTYYCASQAGTIYDNFMNPYFQWMDLVFYAILPFIIMLLSTIFILRVIFMSNKRLGNKLQRNSVAFLHKNSITETEVVNDVRKSSSVSILLRKQFHTCGQSRKQNHRLNKTIHLTYTLISINALFICLVSPLAIVLILIKGKEKVIENKFVFSIVYLLAYANHSFNFIFYGLSSPPYRNAVKNLILNRGNKSNMYASEYNKSKRRGALTRLDI